MHSRIAGTGSYLPAQVLTNDDLARRIDTSDAWIRARTGIRERRIAAPDGNDERPRRARVARRARGGRHRSGRRRSHRRGDDNSRHGVSVDRLRAAGEARRARRTGVRRAGGVQRIRLRARGRRPDGRRRPGAQRSRRRRRDLFAHSRLEGPRHVRALRRRRRRGGARAVGDARHTLRAPARRRRVPRHPVRSGHDRQRRGRRARRSCGWTVPQCSSSPST